MTKEGRWINDSDVCGTYNLMPGVSLQVAWDDNIAAWVSSLLIESNEGIATAIVHLGGTEEEQLCREEAIAEALAYLDRISGKLESAKRALKRKR
jgi:hypothetical protein